MIGSRNLNHIFNQESIKLSSNKSFSSETAKRYALALYELAKENLELETVENDVIQLSDTYNKNENLNKFMTDPTQTQLSQTEVINKILLQMNLSKITKNFISILVIKRRIFFLNKIFKSFLSLVSEKKGEVKVSLVSSKDLTNEELKNLNSEISDSMGTQVLLDYKVDETLIGGLRMQIGSLMIDTSIRNKLKNYEQIMLEV